MACSPLDVCKKVWHAYDCFRKSTKIMATQASNERPTWRSNDSTLNKRAIFALVLGTIVSCGIIFLQLKFGK